jgi:hypothetical protein
MSISDYDDWTIHRPEQGELDRLPEPFPWCLACGYQHPQGTHCEGCNGDHSAGYCMTDDLAASLAVTEDLRERVEREADCLVSVALEILRQEGGK